MFPMVRIGLAGLVCVAGALSQAQAEPRSGDAYARELAERRAIERRAQQRFQTQQNLTPERSRPVPPASPNSRVVPNR